MNFEKLSEKYKEIKSPETTVSTKKEIDSENPEFIHFLKKQEAESKKKYFRMYILYAIGTAVYLSVFIINPDSDLTVSNRIIGTCFVAAFAILLFLFRKRYTEIDSASFLDTPKKFLINAKKRYHFWNKQQIWLIPVLLLINFGTTLSVLGKIEILDPAIEIMLIQLVFWTLMIFGFFMGKKEWLKTKKPILRKIEKLIGDFEA